MVGRKTIEIQIQHLLKLNSVVSAVTVLQSLIQIQHLLKLNNNATHATNADNANSNTTLVKVKLYYPSKRWTDLVIQIQHLLKLNDIVAAGGQSGIAIQIQHLLKLNK